MARVDNLENFFTDVADSIRSKTGKSDTITPADFDTEIESIETDSKEITNINDLISESTKNFENFNNYLQKLKNNYEVYTQNEITLYSPEGYQYYVIQKRSNNTYRIIWSEKLDIISFYNESNFKFCGLLVANPSTNPQNYIALNSDIPYSLNYFKNNVFNLTLNAPASIGSADVGGGVFYPNRFYYSNEFNTVEELINAITTTNSNIVYTKWTNGYAFGAKKDMPYDFAYTNCNILNFETGNFLNGKIISHNETILTLPE